MIHQRTFMKTLTVMILVLVIALAGCGGTTPAAPTGATTPQATAATNATSATGSTEPTATTQTSSTDSAPTTAAESAPVAQVTTTAATSCAKLNLNDLSEDELMSTIPGFSSRMVREFFEYRPYASIQQFRKEIGKYVDAATVATYEQYVYVPVDPNNSDAQTLMQLPGVDEATAQQLISGRPYASNEAFLSALSGKVNAQRLSEASCYLVANQQ